MRALLEEDYQSALERLRPVSDCSRLRFYFKSPLSRRAILAEEVGLGKTIEAGLVCAQKSTEGKRCILIVAPAKSSQAVVAGEILFLPTPILEARNLNRLLQDF